MTALLTAPRRHLLLPGLPHAAPVPPPPTGLVHAIDVHSAWGTDLSHVIAAWSAAHVVLHTYTKYENPRLAPIMIAQADSVRRAGATVGNYVWAFGGYDPQRTLNDMLELALRAGVPNVAVAWADCEIYDDGNYRDLGPTDPAWLRTYRREGQRLGVRTGAYTGLWWIDAYFQGGRDAWQEFADWPQWLAEYDDDEDIDAFRRYSGVTQLAGKQYWAKPVDLDVFRAEYTVAVAAA